MANYEIAQLNIAKMLALIDATHVNDFAAIADRIYELAEQSKGFVWRLQSEQVNATEFRPFGDDMLVNMSVWQDIESLYDYVYRSAHVEIMGRREQWFERIQQSYSVLWLVRAGSIPSIKEGKEKLHGLQRHGPTSEAFTFNQPFPPPD